MEKPKNPYRKGCMAWNVFEGDWEDLTVNEIAEVLDSTVEKIQDIFRRIRRETGWKIIYTHKNSRGKPLR